MFYTCRQIGTRFSVALVMATLLLALPVLARPICKCGSNEAAQEKAPACCSCCAQQDAGSLCDDQQNSRILPPCCTGTVPCQCPHCLCSLRPPDVLDTSGPVSPIESTRQLSFLLPLPVAFSPAGVEQSGMAAFAAEREFWLRAGPLHLLYCVWII
jgi:hypothetical protein